MKKRNIRKTAAALTALALCAGVLTGCGGAASSTASSVAASSAASSEASGADADALAAQNVADLIDAIYVQQRTDDTDAQCEAAKAAWDALTDAQKELVEGENGKGRWLNVPKDKLTPKQKKFCDEYLKLGNATQAAKNAGYSEKTAYRTGADNLKVPHILDYINARQEQIASKDIADIEEIMKYLTDVMRGKIKDQFDLDASLSERTKAAQELLKRNVDDRKMNLELAKLEAQFKDNGSDEDAKDNFMDALNSTASEVWTDDE